MNRKMVEFFNKNTKECKLMNIGSVGANVFGIVGDTYEMNRAISWCNNHEIGEVFERDEYVIKLVEERPVNKE